MSEFVCTYCEGDIVETPTGFVHAEDGDRMEGDAVALSHNLAGTPVDQADVMSAAEWAAF